MLRCADAVLGVAAPDTGALTPAPPLIEPPSGEPLDDGSRIDIALYVDDGYVVDSGSHLADEELARLHDRFTIAVKDAKVIPWR